MATRERRAVKCKTCNAGATLFHDEDRIAIVLTCECREEQVLILPMRSESIQIMSSLVTGS